MAIRLTGETAPGKSTPTIRPANGVCPSAQDLCTYAELRTYATDAAFLLAFQHPSITVQADRARLEDVLAAAGRRPEAAAAARRREEWRLAADVLRSDHQRHWVIASYPQVGDQPFWEIPLAWFTPDAAFVFFAALAVKPNQYDKRLILKESA